MEKIGHVRIDDRLIHGQIVASWINVLRCTTIIVADDKAVADPLQNMMLSMACPQDIDLKIVKVTEAAQLLTDGSVDRSKSLVIVHDVQKALELLDCGNVEIDEINVGNVSSAPKRKKFSKSVWLTDEEISLYRQLAAKGVKLEVRVVPNEKATDLISMIGK